MPSRPSLGATLQTTAPKLLSVNNYHYRRGGSDAVFLQHDALFSTRGWQTAVMSMHHPQNLPSPWAPYFVEEIEYEHAPGILTRLSQAGKVIWSVEARQKMAALLDRFKADIVHAHCVYHHLSPSVLAEVKRRGIPLVMTAHDLKLACPAYKMLNAQGVCERCRGGNLLHLVQQRCIRNSTAASTLVMLESLTHRLLRIYRDSIDLLIVPSRFYLEKLAQWGWDRSRMRYIPNAVPTDGLQAARQPGRSYLYFGRLAPEKGVDTLVRAAARSRQPVVIAGTGPMLTSLQALAQQLNAPVQFVGYQTGERLHALVRQSRAVVIPSQWYENAPMSVLESFAMGVPVIAADIGGLSELVTPQADQQPERTAEMHAASMADSTADSMADAMNASITVSGAASKLASEARLDAERRIDCSVASHDAWPNGWTFESGDERALARLLDEVGGMSDTRVAQMGRAAREHVQRHFSTDAYYDRMTEVYSSLGVRMPRPRSGS